MGAKGAGKVASFGVRTAAKIATLGHMGSKKNDDGAGKTKAQKRQRAVRRPQTLHPEPSTEAAR